MCVHVCPCVRAGILSRNCVQPFDVSQGVFYIAIHDARNLHLLLYVLYVQLIILYSAYDMKHGDLESNRSVSASCLSGHFIGLLVDDMISPSVVGLVLLSVHEP